LSYTKKLLQAAKTLGLGAAVLSWGWLLYKQGKKEAQAGPTFGVRSEWERFVKTYPVLSDRLGLLNTTMIKVFIRKGTPRRSADSVVFFLGRKCCEEFYEILLLCGNGYGAGATKLLRTLYENALTMAYIAAQPEEADMFLDYNCVHDKRMLDNFKKVEGLELESAISAERMKEIVDNYESMKNKFQTTDCKKCGTRKLQQSWTKKALRSWRILLAKDISPCMCIAIFFLCCKLMPLLRVWRIKWS
jgi:hypothetical protein